MLILLPAAFIAGLFTILAPCTLPVVPLVLGSATGGGARRPAGVVVGFAISFVLTAVALATILASLGLTTDRLRLLAIVGLAGMGLQVFGVQIPRQVKHGALILQRHADGPGEVEDVE